MSAMTSTFWKSHRRTASVSASAQALPFPDASEVSDMRQTAIALRDTMIVMAIQLVFRASLAMRRWNY
jgi:hypothetical protein